MTTSAARAKLIKEVGLRLGAGMIDIEFDPAHYDLAVDIAFDIYRQRSSNAMEESFLFLDVQPDVPTYTLPPEVQEVRTIYRRNMGATGGGGATIDPFALAFTNNLYMIGNPGGLGAGGAGTLATYELAMDYQKLVGRMFGQDLTFTFNSASKRLLIHRRFTATEEICLHVYNTKPDEMLLSDPYARPWLRAYAVAQAKLILGEAYSKYQSLAGAQGGITLKGDALKSEGQTEIDKLEKELFDLIDGHEGYGFIIG